MKSEATFIHTALTTVLALSLTAMNGSVAAANDTPMEKCAGIVKAGQNDCATSTTACHGHVTVNSHPEGWIYVPQGTCEKIVGAHVTNQKAPDEKSSRRERPHRHHKG
jgi:uncharacterized membrane protein